jgi:type I restriction enzyme, S subunit
MDGRVARRVDEESEGPWPLPKGWFWTALGSVTSLRGTKVDPLSEPDLPFVGMDDIEAHGTSIVQTRPFGTMKSAGNRFFQDDVLYGRLRPYLNKTALAAVEGACSGELLAITPSRAVVPKFIQLFMHARRFVNTAMGTVSGDRPRIDFATIAAFDFPLAPVAEQKRIVGRVDTLFAEIAEGQVALAAARKGLDTFRRALLKAAVTGELTKDWRAENEVSETGHELLERIANSRVAKAPSKGRGRRAADAPPLDTTALPALPEGWAWGTFDQVKASDQRNGISIAGSPSPPGTKAMRLDALTAQGINLGAIRYIPLPEDRIAGYRVNAGDMLISRANGSAEFVGRAVYVSDIAETVVFPDTMIRYPLGGDTQIGRWMEMAWNSPLGRRQIRRMAKTTAGILKISQEDISQISLPIPPPAEAAEILRRVSEALAASADTLAMLDAEAADAARLKQSILKSAFEGRLVPQDPADEPASVTLARLKVTPLSATSARCVHTGRRGRPRKNTP